MDGMGRALSESEMVQNGALAAYTLWVFGRSYQDICGAAPLLLLHFIVLPIVFHTETSELVTSTNRKSGLPLFAAKLAKRREDLLALQGRALAFRPLTLDGINLGIRVRLLTVDFASAAVRSNTLPEDKREPEIPHRVRPIIAAADKIGAWLAALPLDQIAATLSIAY